MSKIEITEQVRQAYLTSLQEVLTETEYSAYGVATVLNKVLAANGRNPIRPQMMYNYLRNGLLVSGQKIFGETLRPLTASEVAEFLIRYATRNEIVIKFVVPESVDQLALFDLSEVPTE
jgi:hypothetical protein